MANDGDHPVVSQMESDDDAGSSEDEGSETEIVSCDFQVPKVIFSAYLLCDITDSFTKWQACVCLNSLILFHYIVCLLSSENVVSALSAILLLSTDSLIYLFSMFYVLVNYWWK